MSDLLPSLIPLDKGLNLQTAKLVAPAGSVLDTLNYEQVDFQGQKRIDGFARYDGSHLSAMDEYYKITLDVPMSTSGNVLLYTEGGVFARLVDTFMTGDSDNVIYAGVINENLIPVVGDTIYVDNALSTSIGVVQSIVSGTDSGVSVDEHYNRLLLANQSLRDRVMSLPGGIIGLHWFRDRLYAVADVAVISLAGTTPAIYPNDVLNAGGNLRVLDSYIRDNTRLVFVDAMTPEEDGLFTEGTPVTRGGLSVGTVANGYENLDVNEEIASFYVALNEQQALDAGTYWGWHLVNHGWKVNFTNATSLYGTLPSLNQNIKGLGIQGPTSVSGDNGRPLVVTQKVSITNEPVQVNGWKNSQSPTSYALESDNLIDIDGDTIYADAYISWDGSTGVVTGLTDTLTEYAASSTVVIEI